MKKEFIPYEQALALKELGFDEPCFAYFDREDNQVLKFDVCYENKNLSAPTFSQAFRWFREKYGIPSHIATYWQHDWNDYSYQYYFVENKKEWNDIEHYNTYEEAELACLKKLIEIVKTK